MIQKSLQFTHDVLSQFLTNAFNLDENKVVLNTIIDTDGNIPLQNKNKVVVSLINVERETLKPFYGRNQKLSNGNYAEIRPSERYNLDILITSNFDDYSETLKFLNAVILFFQTNTAVDSASFSSMPGGINRLEYDIEKITYHQMHSLWTAMGAKYQPSVIYKMRLLTLQAGESHSFTTELKETKNSVSV